ncbi:site-specific integrase [Planktomarina temperata]|nr:site-specific integrase [Planktomarina temperata]
MKLNKTVIKDAQPTGKRYKIQDQTLPGFFLRVEPTGGKSFYVRYRTPENVQRDFKIGTPESLTPDQARAIARETLGAVAQGKDPGGDRRAKRTAPTLKDLAVRYMAEHGSKKKSGHNDEILWRRHLLPTMGMARVALLSREQVRRFHSNHPSPNTANRAVEVLSKAMDLAKEWAWTDGENPCLGIKAFPEQKRKRYLSSEELERLRVVLNNWTEREPESKRWWVRWRFAQMIRLLLLTGARTGNIMRGRWEWLSWNQRTLTVPAEEHKTGGKTGEELVIHLSDDAVRILRDLQTHNTESPWIIPGMDPAIAMTRQSQMWNALLKDAEIDSHPVWGQLRIHDLRHSFASFALSNGLSLGVVGQLLGHQSTQTTSRYAHLMQEAAQQAVDQIGQAVRL